MRRTAALVGLALLLVAGPALGADPDRRGLLVGVGDPTPGAAGWTHLAAEADVRRLSDALLAHGVPPEGMRTLTGSSATRAGILDAIETHLAGAPVGSHLLLHWSGHGHRLPDRNHDEPDGLDEAWVPSGALRDGPARQFLLDDELAGALEDVRRAIGPLGSLVVTIDACHAAGSTRGGPSSPPSAPEPSGLVRVGVDGLAPMVVLSAARADQVAREVLGPDGEPTGAFSSALADTLLADPAPTTWQAVHERVRARVVRAVPTQQPQLEGRGDLAVFGSASASRPWFVTIAGVLSDGRFRLAGGRLHGLTDSARLEVHRTGSDRRSPETLLLLGTLEELGDATAFLRPDGRLSEGERIEAAAGRAFLLTPPPPSLTLQLTGPERWRSDWLGVVAEAGVLVVDGPADLSLRFVDGVVTLDDGSGREPLASSPGGEPAVEQVSRALRRLAATRRVLNSRLEAPALAVGGRLLQARPGTCEVTGEVPRGPAAWAVHVGDTLRLEVTHAGELPVWLSVVHVDDRGFGRQILPGAAEQAEALAPGEVWRSPSCWTVMPPTGTERLRVIATRHPLQLGAVLEGQSLRAIPPDGFATDLVFDIRSSVAGSSR